MVTTMDDLAAFIEARLDEDEAAAMAWKVPSWGEDASEWKAVGARLVRYDNGCTEGFTAIDVSGRPAMFAEAIQVRWDTNGERVAHITRHDPARVLREVAAKRAILPAHGRDNFGCQSCQGDQRCPIPFLAAIWSDHPDYRAEWATA
jgi:hypothetical protein